MPEHFHPLISEPQELTPSTVMQALKLGFVRRVIAEAKRLADSPLLEKREKWATHHFDDAPQQVWEKRFYDFNVWTERKRVEKLRYMHRNPVKGGLVASPKLWRWSSFRCLRFRGSWSSESE